MDQYLIEVQNISDQLVVLTCPAKAPVMLTASLHTRAQKLALTSDQFLSMAYDLEGFSEGKHRVTKCLQLYVTDRVSGRCEAVDFATADLAARSGLSADETARLEQDKQEAEHEAARKKALAYSAPTNPDSLAGAVQQGVDALSRPSGGRGR